MSIRFLNLPATEAWKEMMKERKTSKLKDVSGKELDVEELKVIYKLKEDGKEAVLYDFYEEGMEFEGDGIVVPLSSTYNGTLTYMAGTRFVNVIGSSGDPMGNHEHGSWIALYEFITRQSGNVCYSDGNLYKNGQIEYANLCPYNNNRIIGGHVIIGSNYPNAWEPNPGDAVGIVPICQRHNKLDSGYMQLRNESKVVMLNYTVDFF